MNDSAASSAWTAYESGATIGQRGSDDGLIIVDEEYSGSARITLERDVAHLQPAVPFTITCGIYGWMVHTRFFDDEAQAREQLGEMKHALAAIADQLPDGDDDVASNAFADKLAEFIHRYP